MYVEGTKDILRKHMGPPLEDIGLYLCTLMCMDGM